MLSKKRSGFVLLLLVSVLFFSVFVSSTSYTQTISSGNWSQNHLEYQFNLFSPMNVTNITMYVGTLSRCNISIYTDSSIASKKEFLINSRSQKISFSLSEELPVSGIVISSASVAGCNIYNNLLPINVSVSGDYTVLKDIKKSFVPGLAPNNDLNISISPVLDISQINLSFTSFSSSSNCVISISTLSNGKLINVDSFNLNSLAPNRALSRFISIGSPTPSSKIVIRSSANSKKVYCYNGSINFTNLTVVGKNTDISSICVQNWQNTSWYYYNTTHQYRNETDGCGILNVHYRLIPPIPLDSCSSRCGNITSSLAKPSISSFPSNCSYSGSCNRNVNFGSSNSNVVYDLVWRYNYYSGSSVEICACNGTTEVAGHVVRSAGPSVPMKVIDENTRAISSVDLEIYAFNGTARSAYANYTLKNIEYGCSNVCFKLGNTSEIEDSDPTNYLYCGRVGGSYCFNWTNKSCSDNENSMWFNPSAGACQNNGTYSCTSEGSNIQAKFCNFSSRSLSQAQLISINTCGLDSFNIGCYQCNNGYKYDSSKGYCTKCVGNQQIKGCEENGGRCNNSNTFNGAPLNDSLDCCNPDFKCFKCDSGEHFYNDTCVSNICSGGVKPLENASHVIFGVNNTTNSSFSMVWNYVNDSAGPCQWTCSIGYKVNISDGVISCVEKEKFNCSAEGGICSTAATLGNATVNPAGNCTDSSQSCKVCNSGFKPNAARTACIPKTCEDSNLVNNGLGCVQNISCSGCILEKNTKFICLPDKTKLKINNTQYFCDANSSKFKTVLSEGSACKSNEECNTNFCYVNQTSGVSQCLKLEELGGMRKIITDFVCWFTHMGDAQGRQQCTEEEALNYIRAQVS